MTRHFIDPPVFPENAVLQDPEPYRPRIDHFDHQRSVTERAVTIRTASAGWTRAVAIIEDACA